MFGHPPDRESFLYALCLEVGVVILGYYVCAQSCKANDWVNSYNTIIHFL